jgi:hypothetical protein
MKSFIEKYSEIIVWVLILIPTISFIGCVFYLINNH